MPPGTIRILVIDDEPSVCRGCQQVLSENGYQVETRPAGLPGLAAASRGDYAVILLDLKLPDIAGMELLTRLRRETPRSHVIIITGYSTVKNAVEAMKAGAFHYLPKPFSDDELLLTVGRAVENRQLVDENLALRQQLSERFDFDNIVSENPVILRIFEDIKRIAPTDSTVLIEGASGTGKELFARAIHAQSRRAAHKFLAVDCSTFTTSLLESELFGHVKGAFTGAVQDKAGILAVADGGTLFLDEVGNLSLEIQAKLLRVMETSEFKPVGASHFKTTDVRVIAATNRELKQMVETGGFREDLFYRLNVVPIWLPPLQERPDDIPRLAYHFLRFFCRKTGKRIDGFTDDALEILVQYDWPGNVRQLKNVIERLVILTDRPTLGPAQLRDNLQGASRPAADATPTTAAELQAVKRHLLEKRFLPVEKAFLTKALQACSGNITRAAAQVGMQRSNFSTLMKKHGLDAKSYQN